ncbi:MAG TPA: farnesyl diphosphate synthase [Chitinispirillaceae bacterium]|jgi:geranylgeranyl diphosphate synthase type II|nr:farnesyl diphosphate synthase [Chitinispirillaceae bacterium]
MDKLKEFIKKTVDITDQTLQEVLPSNTTYPDSIHKLMRYSMFAGGKRIRPCLLIAAYEACGGSVDDKQVQLTSAAVEMLHTFSLIHDDLPCMDDDDYRRGKLTAHKAFNEALAVLGGDALCIGAFEILSRTARVDIIREIATALGTQGMIGGQVVDIESEGKTVTREIVEYIHNNKTAALICSSVRIGAMLANASEPDLQKFTSFGNKIGLAFQVVDDILDEESTTEQLGKDAGSDRERGKATFPAVVGIEESKRYARKLIDGAWNDIAFLNEKGKILHDLAEYIITRIS